MSKAGFDVSSLKGRRSLRFSQHAAKRQSERCIPPFIIDALIDFGDERHVGGGCRSYSFAKSSWQGFKRYMGKAISAYDKYRNVYLVVAEDGAVVTVAWRH